jgi:hypothetical protein
VTAPEEFPDEAWEEPGPDGLTPTQFAARVSAKREEAAQAAGWVKPPEPDAPLPEGEKEPEAEAELVQSPPVEEEPPEVEEAEGEEVEGEEPPEGEADLEEGEEEEGEFYARRYRDKESTEKGLDEKDATINQLYRELHERNLKIERAAEAEPAELDHGAWQSWAEEVVENGGGVQGAMAALEAGGEDGFDIYISAWSRSDDPEERAQALVFNNKVQRVFAERRVQQALQAEQRQPDRSSKEEAELAKQRAAATRPDFDQYTEAMDRLATEEGLLPEETKQWLADLAQDGIEGKMRAWDYLYLAAKAMNAPSRRRAQEAERKQRRASGDRAKVQAMVSSSEATPTRTPLSEAELTVIRKKNELRERWGLEALPEE